MKYSPKLYARAFSEVAADHLNKNEEVGLVKNFLEVIRKNNDAHQLKKIFAETEKLMRMKTGRRSVTIETARAIKNLRVKFSAIGGSASGGKHFLSQADIIEEKINPELLAGVKITVNNEVQFDGSLKRKLEKLFT